MVSEPVQSETSIIVYQPIRREYCIVSTNQRKGFYCVHQSETSIIMCQPIRRQCLPESHLMMSLTNPESEHLLTNLSLDGGGGIMTVQCKLVSSKNI